MFFMSFPCFFVLFFSNWQHSIIATRKFCSFYGVWLANVGHIIISFASAELCSTRKATEYTSISGFPPRKCLRRNGVISSARSLRFGAAKEWLSDSRSLRNQPGETTCHKSNQESVGGKKPGRNIKLGLHLGFLNVFPGGFGYAVL